MAIEAIEVYPTCDVHLLMSVPTPMKLTVRDKKTKTDISAHVKTKYLGFKNTVVQVNQGIFTPVGLGPTIGRIKHTDITGASPIVSEVLVRVIVHNSIDEFWIGNNRATIHKGESNYVLTVYAKFNDGTFGDISGHPYLNFHSTNTSKITISNTASDRGRLKGVAESGAVAIKVTHNAVTKSINAFVSEPLTKKREILKRIHVAGNYSKKRNILILSEGFLATQEAFFIKIATKLKNNLFKTNSHVPYNKLKDDFNVWVAFDSSPEAGVSIASPITKKGIPVPYERSHPCDPDRANYYSLKKLISIVGLPRSGSPTNLNTARSTWSPLGVTPAKVDQKLFKSWSKQKIYGYLQARDSEFGFGIGKRFGDRNSSQKTLPINQWYVPSGPTRRVIYDRRRCNLNWKYEDFLYKYISSLRYGTNPSDINYNVYKTWLKNKQDKYLVCFLVNEEHSGGTNFGQFAISIGKARKHPSFKSGNKFDHVPKITNVNYSVLTSTLAHEAAHSFRIGDEYEGFDHPDHRVLQDTNIVYRYWITYFKNLTHLYEIRIGSGTQINANKIIWNWHRIKLGSTITQKATSPPGINKIKVKLKAGEGAQWQPAKNAATEVFLRHKDMNINPTDLSKGVSGPLFIDGNIINDVIVLKGARVSSSNKFPKGSLLFEPRKDSAGNILYIMDEKVKTHINTSGKAFKRNPPCSLCSKSAGKPDKIINFSPPWNDYQVIGLYEGGGTFNCRVYRPAGACKMRHYSITEGDIIYDASLGIFVWDEDAKKHPGFCFVCKYILVNEINPSKLNLLKQYYPE